MPATKPTTGYAALVANQPEVRTSNIQLLSHSVTLSPAGTKSLYLYV